MEILEPRPFYVDYVSTDAHGMAVLTVHGDLDLHSHGELRSTLCLIGYVFSGVVVDLSDVSACDELGWRAIRETDEFLRSKGRRLILREPSPPMSSHLRRSATELGIRDATPELHGDQTGTFSQ